MGLIAHTYGETERGIMITATFSGSLESDHQSNTILRTTKLQFLPPYIN